MNAADYALRRRLGGAVYLANFSLRETGRLLGVSGERVRQWLVREGIASRSPGFTPPSRPAWTVSAALGLAELGLNRRQAFGLFGLSPTVGGRGGRRHSGQAADVRCAVPLLRSLWQERRYALLVSAAADGATPAELAEIFGVSQNQVYSWLHRRGIGRRAGAYYRKKGYRG